MQLTEKAAISIGKLGIFQFYPGYYLYAGSALSGLNARINRHLGNDKRLHWHVDYFLEAVKVREVWCVRSTERLECSLARGALDIEGAILPARGFGSSDCHCPAHLVYVPKKVSMKTLQVNLGKRISLEKFALSL